MNTQIIRPPAFQKPSGKLVLNSNQLNIADNTATLVELDTIPSEYKDGIENTVTHRITPGRPGFYSIVGVIEFLSVIADKNYQAGVYVSGACINRHVVHSGVAYVIGALCSVPCHYLSAVDFVDLYAYHEAGAGTIDISAFYTYLSVQRVR